VRKSSILCGQTVLPACALHAKSELPDSKGGLPSPPRRLDRARRQTIIYVIIGVPRTIVIRVQWHRTRSGCGSLGQSYIGPNSSSPLYLHMNNENYFGAIVHDLQ